MPWWGWILEIAGVAMLAASIALPILNTIKKKPLTPLSLIISATAAVIVAVLFTILSPRPPAYVIVLSIIIGLAVGVSLSFLAHLQVKGKLVTSSHGQFHIAMWSFLLLASSILVVCGTGATRASVAIMLLASSGFAGYSGALYVRCLRSAGKSMSESGAVRASSS